MGIYLSKDGISYLWSKIKNKFYTKPSGGIPKSDLASSVQTSLNKADSALQSHQDISGKQDKSTAVTHTANTAVGSATKPVYVAADGKATAITHSINADVPANAKFTDTTYSDATQSAHGLMTAADKAKLDGMDLSKYAALSHTHTDLDTVGSVGYYGSNSPNAAGWYKIYTGTITGYENNAATLLIEDGYNGNNVGLFYFKFRCNNGKIIVVQAFDWLIRRGFAADSIGVVTGNNEYSIYLYCDSVQWGRVKVRVLESQRTQHNLTMLLTSNTVKESIEPSFTRRSSDMGIVAEAQSLTDSGWLTPTTTDTSSSTLRYRKQGKIVCVSGSITVSASTAAITPCTLPEGYRPSQNIKIAQAVDNSSQDTYIVTIGTNGSVTYMGKTQGFFKTSTYYYMHCTFFVD